MPFPFGFQTRLRQQLLLAIGSGSWLVAAANGCRSSQPALEQATGRAGTTGSAGRSVAGEAGATARDSMAAMMSGRLQQGA